MAKPYSQDLRDRVIEAVERGKMSRRAAGRHYAISEFAAINWLERFDAKARESLGHGGHRVPSSCRTGTFGGRARGEIGHHASGSVRSPVGRARVKADTSMMSRFFRKIGVTVKKRPWSRVNRIART